MTVLPTRAYRQSPTAGYTRIDLVLALFDGTLDRLDKAIGHLRQGNPEAALMHRLRAQAVVLQLAAGIDLSAGDPTSPELLRLYEFCAHTLARGTLAEVETARKCLDVLREGFRAIREEAVQLERSGAIPAADDQRLVEAVG